MKSRKFIRKFSDERFRNQIKSLENEQSVLSVNIDKIRPIG